MSERRTITPQYGWGWRRANDVLIETPAPFEIEILQEFDTKNKDRGFIGRVITAEHPLATMFVTLWQGSNDTLTVLVHRSPPDEAVLANPKRLAGATLITGYAGAWALG